MADPEAQELMRIREKAIRDYTSDIASAKDEGKAIGIEKGATAKAQETAIKLLSMGLSIEQTSQATGLTIETITELKIGDKSP